MAKPAFMPGIASSSDLLELSALEVSALAGAVEVVGADGTVKTDFLVLPYGDPIEARDGRKWILRAGDHAARVLAATRELLGATEMMIDYDHQAAYAATGNGNRAEAAGWVKGSSLRAEADGIHLTVDWTDEAKAALAARKYRYISPDFRFAKASGEVTRIVRAGLTNSPALDLPALAHLWSGATPGEEMAKTLTFSAASMVALATALAIKPDELDETKALAAIVELANERTALAAVRSELELDADADEAVAIAAIRQLGKAAAPDPSKFVPKAGYDELAARLSTIEEIRVLASVDQAVADGKLAPSMKKWAIDLGKSDEPALAAFIAAATPFAGAGTTVQGEPKTEKGKLTAEEKAICSLTGVSETDFLKTRDEEAA